MEVCRPLPKHASQLDQVARLSPHDASNAIVRAKSRIAMLVVIAWVVIFAVLIHDARVRRRDLIIPIAALAVGLVAVLHSLIDFSLQIPHEFAKLLRVFGVRIMECRRPI